MAKKARSTDNGKGTGSGSDTSQDLEESQGIQDFEFVKPEELPKTIDDNLRGFLQRENLLDNEYTVTLYKFDNEIAGSRKRSMLFQWGDDFPGEHEIGLRYGGGRYLVILNITDKEGKHRIASCKFRLASHYDDFKKEREKGGINPLMLGQFPPVGKENLQGSLLIIKEVIEILKPLINKPSDGGTPIEYMAETYKAINKTLVQSMLDNTQLINDIQRKSLDLGEVYEDEEETTGIMGVINTLSPILEKAIPVILGSNKSASMDTVKLVKNLPIYKELIKNKKQLNVFTKFVEEKHGKKIADNLLRKFNVRTPA